MNEERIKARIDELTREITERVDERSRLKDMLDGPTVRPIAHYWRHYHEEQEVFDTFDEAVAFLRGGDEYDGYAVGVSVGGVMTKLSDIEEDA